MPVHPAWLGNLDSNQDKQSQSLLCYRYTIPQRISEPIQALVEQFGGCAQAFAPISISRCAVLPARSRTWQGRLFIDFAGRRGAWSAYPRSRLREGRRMRVPRNRGKQRQPSVVGLRHRTQPRVFDKLSGVARQSGGAPSLAALEPACNARATEKQGKRRGANRAPRCRRNLCKRLRRPCVFLRQFSCGSFPAAVFSGSFLGSFLGRFLWE